MLFKFLVSHFKSIPFSFRLASLTKQTDYLQFSKCNLTNFFCLVWFFPPLRACNLKQAFLSPSFVIAEILIPFYSSQMLLALLNASSIFCFYFWAKISCIWIAISQKQKVEAIVKARNHETITELQSSLGMIQ